MELLSLHEEILVGDVVEFHAWGTDGFGKYRSIYGNIITPQSQLYSEDGTWLYIDDERYREQIRKTIEHYTGLEDIDRIDIKILRPVDPNGTTYERKDDGTWQPASRPST